MLLKTDHNYAWSWTLCGPILLHPDIRSLAAIAPQPEGMTAGYMSGGIPLLPMPSDAEQFEANFDTMKEFVDEDGRHYFVIKFNDESGRIFRKRPSEDGRSIAEFVVRDRFAKEGMRRIDSAIDFGYDEEANTQNNLRNLMDRT